MSSESEDVFFHGSRCYQLADNGTELPGLTHAAKTVEQSLIDPPKRGDTILFVAESGPKGLRATRWVKWSDDILETVLDEIVERPRYQLIERIGPPIKEGELVLGSEKRLIVNGKGRIFKSFVQSSPNIDTHATKPRQVLYFSKYSNKKLRVLRRSDPR